VTQSNKLLFEVISLKNNGKVVPVFYEVPCHENISTA